MKKILFLGFIVLLNSCIHKHENTAEQQALFAKMHNQPLDTLIVTFASCTECLDVYYIQGKLTFTDALKAQVYDTLSRDIEVCGFFPQDLIDLNHLTFDFNKERAFKIIGKIIKTGQYGGFERQRPLFYVKEWTKFDFDQDKWSVKGDLNTYPNRAHMVEGIVENFKLEGEKLEEITNVLGKPDFEQPQTVIYSIDTKYGTDIDPIASTQLEITFGVDSIITSKKINSWKK
jgi:hypothetical protein